ncbi:MAG TPA: acyl-CoA dehydrogenase family protein [Pyrinomonadaceae bacterium]|jgi:alkylation response protein AidB-like acyl-CoA dehydrogenase
MMSDTSFDIPLSKEERRLLAVAHEVCREVVVPLRAELDESGEFPEAAFEKFREAGLFKAPFDGEYDGFGMHPLMPILIAEALGEYCLGIGTIFGTTTFLFPLPLLLGGTPEQRRKYLPGLAGGRWHASFAMTEPEAGSDITSLKTVAVKKGDRYVLNGTKKWITNAGRADLYCVVALTDRGKDPRAGMSCFIVERGTPGLSFGKLENKLGLRCVPNRPVILKDVEVPEESLVGGKPNGGFALAFRSLSRGRCMVAALGVGLAAGAYKEAARYTHRRKQFGRRVSDFQVVQHMLADMLVKIETARALTYKAAWHALVLNHPEASRYAAMAKYYSSEIAMQVATDALQLHGGCGFVKESPVEKMFRDAKVLSIYEGTSQMLKNQIAATAITDARRAG